MLELQAEVEAEVGVEVGAEVGAEVGSEVGAEVGSEADNVGAEAGNVGVENSVVAELAYGGNFADNLFEGSVDSLVQNYDLVRNLLLRTCKIQSKTS